MIAPRGGARSGTPAGGVPSHGSRPHEAAHRRAAATTRPDASPYLDRRPPVAALAPTVLVAVLGFTMAGLLWVRQANSVADTGRAIAHLLERREALLMQRAAARVALAQATDPGGLADRARGLGFVPVEEAAVEVVVVTADAAPAGSAALAEPGRRSPLELIVPPSDVPTADADEPSLSAIPLSFWQALEPSP